MSVFITSKKGNKIAASIHKPMGNDLHTLAVLLPGFLDSKDYTHLVKLGEDFSRYGITSIRFDPTGAWESEGKIEDYSCSQYLKDLKDVIYYMQGNEEEFVQTILVGHSLGGMIGLIYAGTENDVDAVAGIMPPASQLAPKGIQGTLREWREQGVKLSTRDEPLGDQKEREFTVPISYIEDAGQYDVLKVIDQINIPLMLIAGELDDKILPEEVRVIYDKADEPKEWVLLRGVGHDYRLEDRKIEKVNKEIVRFLKEYCII